jgi:hypothetical protein
MPQWRPQVMRYGVTESFQLFIGNFQLRSPFGDPMFEFLIEFSDFALVGPTVSDVAESHHSATRRGVLVFQGSSASLDPNSLCERGIVHKHFSRACLPANGACQGILVGWERCHCVRQEEAVVLSPFFT